ncbi:MAG: hypothetical protein COT17_07490 [Elusimicrobia bacterium CG08_land_8_20_14_0_20_51_18]|nr:MAG: hypothetical protein COT17_07490 [Elusimicrobia bacterium CG08_land_8_20_14_0_20_51_18]
MDIFWRLILAHLIADFTLQTDAVNRMKRKGVLGMLVHVVTHVFVSALLIYQDLFRPWFSVWGFELHGWQALGLMSVVHFLVDETRVYLIKELKYRDNTFNFLADQFAHFYFIFLFSPVDVFKNPLLIQEKWVIIAACLVLVSHVATILIYFIEKDLNEMQFPSFDQKYFMIMERIVMWAFFFAGGYWWIPFLLLWALQILYIRKKRIIDVSNVNFFISVSSAVLFGLVSRYAYYGHL